MLFRSTLVSIETQTIEIREAQTAKTKGEIQDEMEDRRQRDKEKQTSPIYPWDIYAQSIYISLGSYAQSSQRG